MQSAASTPSLPASAEIKRLISLLVVHCSATPSGRPIGPWDAATVINGWHAARGFRRSSPLARSFNVELQSIGYHYVIDVDGLHYTGRHLSEIGAHVSGHNAYSVGICLVGGAEREARYSEPQWGTLARLVAALASTLKIPLQPGNAVRPGVCGHRDLSPDLNRSGAIEPAEWLKTCPGFSVGQWLARGMEPDPAHIFTPTPAGGARA